jgi:CTP synthase (UTP-ammonia lyase)
VLACSLMDQEIDLSLTPGSRLAALYGTTSARERTTCNYGLDPAMQHLANEHGLRIAATDATGEVRAIERIDHPFFTGTLYQPQLTSEPAKPNPVFLGFLEATERV